MRRSILWAGLTLALGLGLTAVVVTAAGLSAALAAGQADVTVDLNAPAHVAPDSQFVANIAYANIGTEAAPNVQVTATLPEGVQFITATDRWGAPLLPTLVTGNVLVWDIGLLPPNSCCGHIFVTEQVSGSVAEGTALTNTANIATTAVESDTTNNTASAVSVVCDMARSAKRAHASEVMPGDVLDYDIVLDLAQRPGSPQAVQERLVELTDSLPFSHQVRFLGWRGDVTGTHDGQMLQWQGRVRAGEPVTLQYRLGVEGVVTPGTVLTNQAQLRWRGSSMQLGPVTTVVTLPHGALALGPYQGGELQHEYGVRLTVPPGAVTDTTRFQFRPLSNTDIISGPPGLAFAHRAFELTAFRFGQDVHQFGQPLTLTVNYSDTDVAGLRRETLRLWYRNGPDGPWARLGEPARVMSGTHIYTTTHLTQFALFAEAQPDLTLEVNAPAHVTAGSEYAVRITYYNEGPVSPPDAWITATLPTGTQFITATDRWGAPLPPTKTAGNTLTWYVVGLSCYKPLDANCGHILMTLATAQNLAEGTELPVLASISTTAVESDTTNNTAGALSVVNDMAGSAKQVHRGQVMPGDVLTYTITLDLAQRPGSPQAAQERLVELTDTLPFSHQARFLGWTSEVTGTHDGQMLQWQGRVRAGLPITLQYRLGVEGVVTPGTALTNQARLGWVSGTMQLGPVTTVVTLPHGALALGPYQGGELRHEYGVTLTVPPGAVTDTTRFQFRPLSNTDILSGPPGMMFAHRAFELTAFRFGQDVHQFGQPLTLTVHYSNTDVAGLKRETLRLWYRNGPDGPWARLGEPARVMSGTHVYTTTHLTQFALFAEAAQRVFLPVVIR